MDYKIIWTIEAIDNLDEILNYLIEKWSQKEVDNFKRKLSKHIELIGIFPKMFPASIHNPKLRKAVLSKQTSIYYQIHNNTIYSVFIFVNSKDVKRLK
jgi:plasmid stabilization system protein ParE